MSGSAGDSSSAAASSQAWGELLVQAGGSLQGELIELCDFVGEQTGRGVRAVKDIKAGTVLVEAPLGCLVTRQNLVADEGILIPGAQHVEVRKAFKHADKILDETDLLAVFLMWARRADNQTHLAPAFVEYLGLLPEVEAGPAPLNQSMFWTEDELDLIQGTDSFQIAMQLKKQVREDFGKIVADVLLKYPAHFPLSDGFTYKEYKWALGILWSRGMDFQKVGGTSFRAMVPFADMFNTDFQGPVSHTYVLSSRVVQLKANRDYKAGEQVFINYTPTSSTRLLQLYGFVPRPPSNEDHECVQLWAPMDPAAPRYAEVQKQIQDTLPGCDPNRAPFLLKPSDPLPVSLLVTLHIQRGLGVPTTSSWNSNVLEELQQALQARKASFVNGGDRKADLSLFVTDKFDSDRARMALYIRMVEGKIIDKSLGLLADFLAKITDESGAEAAAGTGQTAPADDLAALEEMD
ncbi:Histone-lysine N-methyltransferase setd3 [Hondaea fermentalgiana]|uniref:Histone-lysine N-methyltransferase setd3 n=1 Tax=Hondaea fermentalgiana TaxID=2315210 RepID=A0A2R5G812_9STRA|nr:Histone-lysine N-methyltransferase setd3 [Hondaea fermentalgiana]|eukprot:GBG26685.1 Histone-lysine N-methyltransferase setd3 [Hondaea fermentalgiana]